MFRRTTCGPRSWLVRWVALVLALCLASVGHLSIANASANSDIGLSPAAWTATHDGPSRYAGVATERSVPITMADGTILFADIYRPADATGRATTTRLPVIVNITPYSRLITALADLATHIPSISPAVLRFVNSLNFSGTPISSIRQLQDALAGGLLETFGVDRELVRSGYTQVVVEARGTGGSQGVWQVLNAVEQHDSLDVLAWARRQPWSNGHLGMSGLSYSAINQLQAAAHHPPGLDAIVPIEPMTDFTHDVVVPGGGLGIGFLALWLSVVNGLNKIPDISALLRGHIDPRWLSSRISDPAVFFREIAEGVSVPTTSSIQSPELRQLMSANSAMRQSYLTDTAAITTPTLVVGGWDDLFTNAEWRTLNDLRSLTPDKKKLVMGTGYHVTAGADTGRAGQPPRLDVLQRAWFDKWLKGIDNGIDRYAPATSHQFGGGWVQSTSFPRPGHDYRRAYLTDARSATAAHAIADGSLSTAPPARRTRWTVAPGIATACSNDASRGLIGFTSMIDACAEDNRIAERNALTFTSPPVANRTDINGPVNVHLATVTDRTDGFFTAVLSDVSPDGRSRVISTGSMTSSLRTELEPRASGYSPNGDLTDPYYTLDLYHRTPATPGMVTPLDIGLLATDATLAPGHRLRVSVYALDFPQAVSLGPVSHDSGLAPEHVVIDPRTPSWINLPSNKAVG